MAMSTDLPAGRDLDLHIAERVLGFRRIGGPTATAGPVLIPPAIADAREAFSRMPSRGTVPLGYFVTRRYSTDLLDAWDVVEVVRRRGYRLVIDIPAGGGRGYQAMIERGRWFGNSPWCESAPHAICLAALLTAEDGS